MTSQQIGILRSASRGEGRLHGELQTQEDEDWAGPSTSHEQHQRTTTVSGKLKRSSSRVDDSDEDEEEAINTGEEEQEASSPHLKKRKATGSRKKTARKPLQRAFADAAEAEEDAEDQAEGSNVVMESGVFRSRLLSCLSSIDRKLTILTSEQRKGNKLLEKLQVAGNSGVSKRGATELNARILKAAWDVTAETAYPTDEALGTAAALVMGSQSFEDAVVEKGVKEVMELKSKIRGRVTNVIRGETASLVKRNFIRTYAQEYPDLIRQSRGKQVVDADYAADLAAEDQYRLGPADSANRRDHPYASIAFRRLLVQAYPSLLPKDFDVEKDTIQFLGRGHIAFVDNLLWWLLQGNQEVPKDSAPGFQNYQQHYMQTWVDVARRKDTPELKLLRPS